MATHGKAGMSRWKILRVSSVIVLIGVWWWLRRMHSPLAAGVSGWSAGASDRTLWWSGAASGAILAIYILSILWMLVSPWRRHRPDDAMGIGCAWQIFWLFSAMLALLVAEMIWKVRLLVIPIAAITLFTAIPVGG